ncbi:MAG: hypothetical protein AB1644_03495 [Candidatus Zixiibacteriota bacterium]
MHTSLRQIEANRRNARKSTGPKTREGKARVSQNAVKHGLYAKKIVLTSPRVSETQAKYDSLCNAIVNNLDPHSPLECLLARRIANCVWQIERADNSPASLFPGNCDDDPDITDTELLAAIRLHYRYLQLRRRLKCRVNRIHAMLVYVKQTDLPEAVQQVAQALLNNRTHRETNPLLERVL